MAFCIHCGTQIESNASFCMHCGAAVAPNSENSGSQPNIKKQINGTQRKKIFIFLISGLLIAAMCIGIFIWRADYYSAESILTRHIWYTDVKVDQEYYDFTSIGEPAGYYTDLKCYSLRFNEWGKTEVYDNMYPQGADYGTSVVLSYEINEDFDFSRFNWYKEKEDYYEKDWEILENDVLHVANKFYRWNETPSDDTWHTDGDTLRIGDKYLTSKNPGIG